MTERYFHHSADEIYADIIAGHLDLAGAKLREDSLVGRDDLQVVANTLAKKCNSDDNWKNDIEVKKDERGEIEAIYIKTVPFTGNLFATVLYNSRDAQNADPTKDLAAWNRVMTFQNLHTNEVQQ